jgi:hypothetical protein
LNGFQRMKSVRSPVGLAKANNLPPEANEPRRPVPSSLGSTDETPLRRSSHASKGVSVLPHNPHEHDLHARSADVSRLRRRRGRSTVYEDRGKVFIECDSSSDEPLRVRVATTQKHPCRRSRSERRDQPGSTPHKRCIKPTASSALGNCTPTSAARAIAARKSFCASTASFCRCDCGMTSIARSRAKLPT